MQDILDQSGMVLMEAAIVEQLRRCSHVQLHDTLVNAPLLYQSTGRSTMNRLYPSKMLHI